MRCCCRAGSNGCWLEDEARCLVARRRLVEAEEGQLCPNAAAEAAAEMEEEEEAEETLARRDDITAERRLEQRNERRGS